MVNVAKATHELAKLSLMKYFPREDEARKQLVKIVCQMASSDDQIEWLVNRALALYNEWPGPRELRALFCSKFKPKDGIDAWSTIYIASETGGGFPHEPPPRQIAPPSRDECRRLLAGVTMPQRRAK